MSGKATLVIIDVQSGFFDDSEFIYRGNEYLSTIRGLTPGLGELTCPIYVQNDGDKEGFLEPGKPGWPIHPSIAPLEGEIVVHKRTPDSFHNTPLQGELDSRGIKKLIITGFQSDWCIDTTVRRAYSLDYDVTVVDDAHSTYDTKILKAPQIIAHHNSIFGGRFTKLVKATDIDFKKL